MELPEREAVITPLKRTRKASAWVDLPVVSADDTLDQVLARMHAADRSAVLCSSTRGYALYNLHAISAAIAKNPERRLGHIRPGKRISTNVSGSAKALRRGRNRMALLRLSDELGRISGRRSVILQYATVKRYRCTLGHGSHPPPGPCDTGDGGTIYLSE